MAADRLVRGKFFSSAVVAVISDPAKLTFIALLGYSDNAGRSEAHIRRFNMHAGITFGVTPERTRADIDELIDAGLVVEYDIGDRPNSQVPNFRENQRLTRPFNSPMPDPHAGAMAQSKAKREASEKRFAKSGPWTAGAQASSHLTVVGKQKTGDIEF